MMCQRRMTPPWCLLDDESRRKPLSTHWNPSAKSLNRLLLVLAESRTVKGLADRSRSALLATRGNEKKCHRSANAQPPPQPKTAGQCPCPYCHQSFSFRMDAFVQLCVHAVHLMAQSGYHQTKQIFHRNRARNMVVPVGPCSSTAPEKLHLSSHSCWSFP